MKNFFKYGSIAVAGMIAISVGIFAINVATQPLRTASGLMNRTFTADNVINNYEWFHNANGQYLSRVNQIKVSKKDFDNEADKEEKIRIRIGWNAQQQSCRDLVTRYNANSEKINVNIFKGWSLPANLDINTCE